MLRWLRRIALAIGILIAAGVVALLLGFALWRSGIQHELLAESSVAMTARGPVEYAQIGNGPAVLLIHGTPGADHLMVIWKSRQLSSLITSFLRSHPQKNPGL